MKRLHLSWQMLIVSKKMFDLRKAPTLALASTFQQFLGFFVFKIRNCDEQKMSNKTRYFFDIKRLSIIIVSYKLKTKQILF